MRTGLLFTYLSLPLTILRGYLLFIEVNKGDRFDFVAEYDPKCLTKKTYTAIAVTYKSSKIQILKNNECRLKCGNLLD